MRAARSIPANEKGRDREAEKKLGERRVGMHRTEHLLPVGTVLTAVGHLTAVDVPSDYIVRWRGYELCCRCWRP